MEQLELGRKRRKPGVYTGFDVAGNLLNCLLPKFDEKDPDTCFALFEHVAEVRGWSDVAMCFHWQGPESFFCC